MNQTERGCFNYSKFKIELAKKEITKKGFAHVLGITESTLYRKINRGGDFTSQEIREMILFFGKDEALSFLFAE